MTPADILMLANPQTTEGGDYQNRMSLPGQALAQQGLRVMLRQTHQKRWVQEALEAKLFWPQMLAQPSVLAVMETRRKLGRPTIWEIKDDFLHFQKGNPMSLFYQQGWVQELLLEAPYLADAVAFSSEGLQEYFGPLCSQSFVARNAVEPAPLLPTGNPAFVVGMAVSSGHAQDLPPLMPHLGEFLKAFPQAELEIMCDPPIFELIKECGVSVRHLTPLPYLEYQEKLKQWSVFLLTGKADRFNQGRSDGKWLDGARAGAVGLAPDQLPYRASIRPGETGMLYGRPEEITSLLAALFQSPELVQEIRSAAHRFVLQERSWEREAKRRIETLDQMGLLHPGAGEGELDQGESAGETEFYEILDTLSRTGFESRDEKKLKDLEALLTSHPNWPGLREEGLRQGLVLPKPVGETPGEAFCTEEFFLWVKEMENPVPNSLEFLATPLAMKALKMLPSDASAARGLGEAALAKSPHSLMAMELLIRLNLFHKRPVKAKVMLEQMAQVHGEATEKFLAELGLV